MSSKTAYTRVLTLFSLQAIQKIQQQSITSMEIKASAVKSFVDHTDAFMPRTVWSTGCRVNLLLETVRRRLLTLSWLTELVQEWKDEWTGVCFMGKAWLVSQCGLSFSLTQTLHSLEVVCISFLLWVTRAGKTVRPVVHV